MRLIAATLAALILPASLWAQSGPEAAVPGTVPFDQSVLVSGLEGPWEITWGPDDMLWVTERWAGRIDRIDPTSGKVFPAITLDDMTTSSGQDGLLGLALDPGLGQGSDFRLCVLHLSRHVPPRRSDRDRPGQPVPAHVFQSGAPDL